MELNPLEERRGLSITQILSILIILGMFGADFMTVRNLFIEMMEPNNAVILSFILAGALEGLPFYLGMIHSEKIDVGSYNINDKPVMTRGFWIAMIALVVTFFIAVASRLLWIQNLYVTEQMVDEDFYEELIPQLFMMVSPIMTSLLSYVASWFAFRSSYQERLYRIVVKKQDIYNRCKDNFYISFDAYRRARLSLWNSLTEESGESVPEDSKSYHESCFKKIRTKLVSHCITCYPTQIERYTQETNKLLEGFILEMSRHTTLPQTITRITLADIIAEHDELAIDYADCWDYNFAGPDLENELRATLDNALVVAEFGASMKNNRK